MKDFPIVYLNSNDGSGLLAFGEGPVMKAKEGNALEELYQFTQTYKDKYMFGYLVYDLKKPLPQFDELHNSFLFRFYKALPLDIHNILQVVLKFFH